MFINSQRKCFFSAIVRCLLLTTFVSTAIIPNSYAQSIDAISLPAAGAIVNPSGAFVPVLLRGLTVHPENPFRFDFIVDSGNTELNNDELKAESQRLVKYFLASMTIPKDDLWVNLSPYEKGRIIPDELGKTELGRDLLAQDYLLKQLTASLMYPENELGKKFWEKVYARAKEKFDVTDIPLDTFNKVWILPDSATVYENGKSVYVVESKLKVMLDEDYVAMANQKAVEESFVFEKEESSKESKNTMKQIIRDIILPEIEKEINTGKNFALLRQVYNSLILAKWYKETVKKSILTKVYVDKNKLSGVELEDKSFKEQIYARYMEAYKKGVYDYIREDYDLVKKQVIPRKYFSGGFKNSDVAMSATGDRRRISSSKIGEQFNLGIVVEPEGETDKSMLGDEGYLFEFFEGLGVLSEGLTDQQKRKEVINLLNPSPANPASEEEISQVIASDYFSGPYRKGDTENMERWDKDIQYMKGLFDRELQKIKAADGLNIDEDKARGTYSKLIDALISLKDSFGNSYYSGLTNVVSNRIVTRLTNFVLHGVSENQQGSEIFSSVASKANEIAREALKNSLFSQKLEQFLQSRDIEEKTHLLQEAIQIALFAAAPKVWFSDVNVQRNTGEAIEHVRALQKQALNIPLALNSVRRFIEEVLSPAKQKDVFKIVYFIDDNGDSIYHLHFIQAFLKENPNLRISVVAKSERVAIDTTVEDLDNELKSPEFSYLKSEVGKRLVLIREGPSYGGVDLRQSSREMNQALIECDVVVGVGQMVTETLNGIKKPAYHQSYVDSQVHREITGLPRGALYFYRVSPDAKYFVGYPVQKTLLAVATDKGEGPRNEEAAPREEVGYKAESPVEADGTDKSMLSISAPSLLFAPDLDDKVSPEQVEQIVQQVGIGGVEVAVIATIGLGLAAYINYWASRNMGRGLVKDLQDPELKKEIDRAQLSEPGEKDTSNTTRVNAAQLSPSLLEALRESVILGGKLEEQPLAIKLNDAGHSFPDIQHILDEKPKYLFERSEKLLLQEDIVRLFQAYMIAGQIIDRVRQGGNLEKDLEYFLGLRDSAYYFAMDLLAVMLDLDNEAVEKFLSSLIEKKIARVKKEVIEANIILASQSPRRKVLLKEMLIVREFEAAAADIDEHVSGVSTYEAAMRAISVEKALSVAQQRNDGIVIASDTTMYVEGDVLGKVADDISFDDYLTALVGFERDPVKVVSSAVVFDIDKATVRIGYEQAFIKLRNPEESLTKDELDLLRKLSSEEEYKYLNDVLSYENWRVKDVLYAYWQKGKHKNKAGGFGVQDREFFLAVSKMTGNPFVVVGFPTRILAEYLKGSNIIVRDNFEESGIISMWPSKDEQERIVSGLSDRAQLSNPPGGIDKNEVNITYTGKDSAMFAAIESSDFRRIFQEEVNAGKASFALIMPDGLGQSEEIIEALSRAGFDASYGPVMFFSEKMAEEFYQGREGNPLFAKMVKKITSNGVVPLFVYSQSTGTADRLKEAINELGIQAHNGKADVLIQAASSVETALKEAELIYGFIDKKISQRNNVTLTKDTESRLINEYIRRLRSFVYELDEGPCLFDKANAIVSLGEIGSAAKEAVPDLVSIILESSSFILRAHAISTLGKIGVASEEVKEAILKVIQEHGSDSLGEIAIGVYMDLLRRPKQPPLDQAMLGASEDVTLIGALQDKVISVHAANAKGSDKSESKKDEAMLTENKSVGGIDMNEINIKHSGNGAEIEFFPQGPGNIMLDNIEGFKPVIIHLTPIQSVLPILGLEEPKEEKEEMLAAI
ncbi:MAG: Maf family protein [Candidatus Omnitrophica bacterium]|nr:Maf family protein [Candidatus Omnitrophota bacterium]